MTNDTTNTTDSKVFSDAILAAEPGTRLYFDLCQHFANEMYKAIKGRICTVERMAALYPIFREINIEMNEIRETEKKYLKK